MNLANWRYPPFPHFCFLYVCSHFTEQVVLKSELLAVQLSKCEFSWLYQFVDNAKTSTGSFWLTTIYWVIIQSYNCSEKSDVRPVLRLRTVMAYLDSCDQNCVLIRHMYLQQLQNPGLTCSLFVTLPAGFQKA